MKIRYKTIEHERTEDAPFVGALISAIDCKFKCKGCFNRDIKKLPTLTKNAEEIIAEIKSNVFNEGIIFGGLEFSEQPLELLELCKLAAQAKLKIMIYTGCALEQFHARLGKACAKSLNYPIPKDTDIDLLHSWIGSQMLDYYIPDTYYIKCGQYDKDKLVPDKIQFGVTLASENQVIYEIKGVEK